MKRLLLKVPVIDSTGDTVYECSPLKEICKETLRVLNLSHRKSFLIPILKKKIPPAPPESLPNLSSHERKQTHGEIGQAISKVQVKQGIDPELVQTKPDTEYSSFRGTGAVLS